MSEVLTDNELIKKGMEIGVCAGEIAAGEYILKNFKGQMSTGLEGFIEKVLAKAYQSLEGDFDTPAEDIALQVNELFDK